MDTEILSADETLTEDGSPAIKSESLKSYLPLKISTFDDEKEFTRFIKSCERLVRSSPEYREFINFARESLNADTCSLTGEDFDSTGDVELHHYPLNLFEITKAVIDEFIYNDQSFSSFDVANKVIELHFQLKVGFVPLVGTLHKKYHKGNLQIPIEYVLGDYEFLIENYHLEPSLINNIQTAKQITISNTPALEWAPKYVDSNKQIQASSETTNETEEVKTKSVISDLTNDLGGEDDSLLTNSSLDLQSILGDGK